MSEVTEEQFNTLIERLIKGTESGRVEWRPALRESAFVTALNHGSIDVSRNVERPFGSEGDETPVELFELAILDPNGRVADRLSTDPSLSGGDALKLPPASLGRLFRLARNSAMSTESLVDGLILELA